MNGLPGNPVTTGGGLYSVQVPYSWSGTVTPAKPNYVFSPSQRIYSDLTTEQLDQDYTGQNIFDLSNDSELGYNDIALLCSHWLETGLDIPGDFNIDGRIDFADFAMFAGAW